jgi:hypothetical protein
MKFKNLKSKTAVALSLLAASGASFAEDHTALITTASTEGSTNVLAVIGGVIGIAILGFGVSAMISWFRR